ncbi:MAG TPA: hypothetical protein VG796_17465 [Verrucomicrobiales bacterium]|jgi:hypothetical protein|nr:hypothetical protein [Verrucomicrobiales bacterium]
MNNPSLRLSTLAALSLALLCLPARNCSALEIRTWLTIDGKMFDAELVRPLGDQVELKDKDGRLTKVAKSSLSFGDLDYIAENSPPDKTAPSLGAAKPKLPNPAKEIKMDTKVFKKEAGDFKVNNRTYRICETPHFKIMYLKPADPMGVAELAERLWIDTASFHSTFIPKWHGRKKGIILVNDKEAYDDVGSWYADMLVAAGQKDEAEKIRISWPQTGSGGVGMPAKQADELGIFPSLRVFRNYRTMQKKDTNGNIVESKDVLLKEVWVPFNTNVLAGDMLSMQAGHGGAASTDGVFAIIKGHAYYKEILLNGKSETGIAQVNRSSKEYGSTQGFQTDKSWAPEIRKMMKKGGEWTPNLPELMLTKENDAKTKDIAFAYAFARFLQSSPAYLTNFNKMCQKMDVAKQVPSLEEIASIYGFADTNALQKAWVDWMNNAAEFK